MDYTGFPIFQNIAEEDIERMMRCLRARQCSYESGELICEYDGAGREVGVLISGTAQLALWAGDITPAELRTCKDRHRLTRALGAQDDVTVDIAHLELAPGDGLLLCSDGFWEKIQESEMAYDLSGASTALQWLEAMRARLAARGAHTGDNHSAIAMLIR